MGIDARIETERAESLADVPDPRGYFSWGLSLHDQDSTICLKFIDPYGNTIFNQLQLPTLLSELETATASLTERGLETSKQEYLKRAASWPQTAQTDAQGYTTSISLADIRSQFERVISLVRGALDRGPHHYVRFIGD
jgi:hypothetical protein